MDNGWAVETADTSIVRCSHGVPLFAAALLTTATGPAPKRIATFSMAQVTEGIRVQMSAVLQTYTFSGGPGMATAFDSRKDLSGMQSILTQLSATADARRIEEISTPADADAVADDATCKSYGAAPGSDVYVNCRLKLRAEHATAKVVPKP